MGTAEILRGPKFTLNKSAWVRVKLTFKFSLNSENPREKGRRFQKRSKKISKRSKCSVTLILGYTNRFQDRNSKLNSYLALSLTGQKGFDLYEPLGPSSVGVASLI